MEILIAIISVIICLLIGWSIIPFIDWLNYRDFVKTFGKEMGDALWEHQKWLRNPFKK